MIYLFATFATYRIAFMIVNEAGPFGLAERLRTFIFNHTEAGSLWQEGMSCIKCVSWWVAWLVAGLLRPSSFFEFVIFSQGLAGAAVLVHSVLLYLEMMPMVKTMAEVMRSNEE